MANPVTTGYDWLKATELEKEAYANQYYTALFSSSKWATNTLTWSAPTVDFGGIFYTPPGQSPKFTAFSTQDIQQITTFLDYLSSIVNLHFSYSNSASSNIKIGYENMTQGGYANYPPDGRIYISDQYIGAISTPGSYGYSALMHEFGHSLGLKHPFDPSATIPIALETRASTVMSYNAFGLYSPEGFDYTQSYMPIDIQALISLYGKAAGITNTDFTFNFSREASFAYATQNATVNVFSPFYLYDANHKVTSKLFCLERQHRAPDHRLEELWHFLCAIEWVAIRTIQLLDPDVERCANIKCNESRLQCFYIFKYRHKHCDRLAA